MTDSADPAESAPASSAPADRMPDGKAQAGPPPASLGPDVEPDQKDWTWVLRRPCPECGFDAGSVSGGEVSDLLRAKAARWPAVCARPDVRVRPEPRVWSPLEYACHVRDVCRVFEARVVLIRSQLNPAFENWNQDDAAITEVYAAQDPAVVSAQLTASAEDAAAAFDAIGEGDWQRAGRRSNGSLFTLETLGQYFLHDVAHHLHDVRG